MSQNDDTDAHTIILADVAPPPQDHPASTEAPLAHEPIREGPISTLGLIAIAIAVFVIVFVGLKLRSSNKKP